MCGCFSVKFPSLHPFFSFSVPFLLLKDIQSAKHWLESCLKVDFRCQWPTTCCAYDIFAHSIRPSFFDSCPTRF